MISNKRIGSSEHNCLISVDHYPANVLPDKTFITFLFLLFPMYYDIIIGSPSYAGDSVLLSNTATGLKIGLI